MRQPPSRSHSPNHASLERLLLEPLLSLPLARGYRARFPIFSTDVPVALADKLFQTIDVKDRGVVEDASGAKHEAWIIDVDMTDADGQRLMPSSTLWLTDVPPYSVARIQGDNRVELISAAPQPKAP